MPADIVPLEDRWTIVDGLPLFYRAAQGDGTVDAVPIVHVHGFGISGRYLIPTAERLAVFHPTFVPDLPGYGRSHKPPHTLSIPELATSLMAFLDVAGVERAILLGNSMGCLIAIEAAHAYPERVERLILVSPAGGPHNQPLYRGFPQLARDGLREKPRMLPVAVPDYVRFGPFSSLRLFHAMTRYPTVERSLALEIPILIVIGARDPLVSRERLGLLAKTKPNVTLVIHDSAAHAINFSYPKALASVVRAWLDDDPIMVAAAQTGDVVVVRHVRVTRGKDTAPPPVTEPRTR